MIKHTGFTLIESLIYVTCSILLMSMLVSGLSLMYTRCRDHSIKANRFFDLMLAFDYLMRDIQQSTSVQAGKEFLITRNHEQYSWSIKADNLVRTQKKSKTQDLVARHIKKFLCEPAAHGVYITLQSYDLPDSLSISFFVACHGRCYE